MKRSSFVLRALSGAAIAVLLASGSAFAAQDNMPQMPQAHSKTTYTVKSADQGDTLQDERGFGDQAPMVRMMNLMMVEGSGYEGMAMAPSHGKSSGQSMAEMPGMAMGASPVKTSRVPASKTDATYEYQLKGPPGGAKVGANTVVVSIHQVNNHQPAKGLKLKAQVYMTSMDMGLGEPRVKEIAPGDYQLKAVFAMEGPWAVKITLPGGQERVFNFSVK
jgi:hypothetical protein